MATPPDPAALFRDMLGEWEKMTNRLGGEALKTGEFARAMQGASSLSLQAREAAHDAMERVLAAANMPSRDEVIDLSARLARIEESVGRIEALLMAQAGIAPPRRPKPKRTRKAPGGDRQQA